MTQQAIETPKRAPKAAGKITYERVKFIHTVPSPGGNEYDYVTLAPGTQLGNGFESIVEDGFFIVATKGKLVLRVPISNTTGGPVE